MKRPIDLLVTLWPSFPHFRRFACDSRISGVRLNSAMMGLPELDNELGIVAATRSTTRVFFDVKGRQPRVTEVIPNKLCLELRLNHAIEVATPCDVVLKGGSDVAQLDHLEEGGRRLVFRRNPRFKVKAGESLCVRATHRILGDPFTDVEREKVAKVRAAGVRRFFLSYVEEQRDIDSFLELVGRDCEVWLKIENEKGLRFVARDFKKADNLVLVAARGDLYVELDRPHTMSEALRLIIERDPGACVASRILLSVVDKLAASETLWRYVDTTDVGETRAFYVDRPITGTAVWSPHTGERVYSQPAKTYLNDASKIVCNLTPSCADFVELDWLYGVGYRRMMLCDEMCLREDLLSTAVDAFDAFRSSSHDGATTTRTW